jgi:aspartyl-tRNA(Asn)/glutamyl-tRNA(Gln) amidotransferase subunit A
MARSAADCARMLDVLAGHDPRDPGSIDVPVAEYSAGLSGDLTGLRIGVDRLARIAGPLADPALDGVLDAALAELEALGATVVDVEVPFYQEMTTANMVIMLSEALAYHLPDLQVRWSDYFAGTRNIVASGVFYSAADYVQAQRARRVGQKELAKLYEQVDLIATPTASVGATAFADLLALVERVAAGRGLGPLHTGYWDTTGNPVISVPMGYTGAGLPLGLQLAGRPFDEVAVLRAGDAYQSRTAWHLDVPPLVTQSLAASAVAV